MTPEKIERSRELLKKINKAKIPLVQIEDFVVDDNFKFKFYTQSYSDTSPVDFVLSIEQMKIVQNIVVFMAKENLKKLEEEFERL